MTDDRSLERAARSWLEAGPTQAPDRAVDAALLRIATTPQERDWHVPWRTGPMTNTTRLIGAALVIAVVLVGGAIVLRPGPNTGIGVGSTASPSAAPSVVPSASASPSVAPSVEPSASSSALLPLTQAFTSPRHGYSVRYPAGWVVRPATTPWPEGGQAAGPPDPMLDLFTQPGDTDPNRSFVVVSQRLPAGVTAQAWLTAYERSNPGSNPSLPSECWPAPALMEPVTIDGQHAWIHGGLAGCEFTEAVAFAGGRVYELSAYVGAYGVFDRPLFDALLATVKFAPGSANDSPAPSAPSPSPSP